MDDNRIVSAFAEINRLAGNDKFTDAIRLCTELNEEFPGIPRIIHALGVLYYRSGNCETGESFVRKAIALAPDYADAYNSLGNMCKESGRMEEAADMYQRVIALKPGSYLAHTNLALALKEMKRPDEAFSQARLAIGLNPDYDDAYVALGSLQLQTGDAEGAYLTYRKVIDLNPSNSSAHANIIHMMNFLPGFSQYDIYRESVCWGRLHTTQAARLRKPHLNISDPERRLRIGYVSGDFKLHPVAHHLKPVLVHHNAAEFEIFLYDTSERSDFMTDTLISLADYYRDISRMPIDAVEELVRTDGIDILIDLSGHTGHNRLQLFARKPAPVQVSWLGYFNTTGMKAMDYLVTDPVTVPAGKDHLFSEKLLRLPDNRFCYEAPEFAPEVAPSPCSRNGFITFGSFNKLAKVNEFTISLWSHVLKEIPGAKMLIKTFALEGEARCRALVETFAENGIPSDRLILRGESTHPEMLAEYADVDIVLDTFPFNGGATTCEALWMGVPVVTLKGDTPISRQSAAFLHTIGLTQFIADTKAEFVAISRQMTERPEELALLRRSLRPTMASSPLCDGSTFTGHLETAYRRIWQNWCSLRKNNVSRQYGFNRISAEELYNAGVSNLDDKNYAAAERWFRHAVRKKRSFPMAWNNLGVALSLAGRSGQAKAAFRTALKYDPAISDACNNLGREYSDQGNTKVAVPWFRRAVSLSPDNPCYLLNLGVAADKLKLTSEARRSLERAVELSPDDHIVLKVLAGLVQQWGETSYALNLLRKALKIAPTDMELVSTYLFMLNFDLKATQAHMYAESSAKCAFIPSGTAPAAAALPEKHGRIRVGFVSADFRLHPGGLLFLPLAQHYDRSRFSFHCYSNSTQNDQLTDKIAGLVDGWHNIHGSTDAEVAEMVKDDRVHVLFDLNGHTMGHRLQLFSQRPAPVLVSWLGYFNTTGVRGIDFIIGDDDFILPGQDTGFSESAVRLPYSRFCYQPPERCPEVVEAPSRDSGYITFGCFNNSTKLSQEVIEVWARVMRQVPNSRLILKWGTFKDKVFCNYFRSQFEKQGISPRRIELRGASSHYMMLAEYGDVDIALDPFPYTGGMTSLEALWMGVPVVTLAGELPVSRQTKSFLGLVGLESLVASSYDEYVEIAAGLAADSARLADIRSGLRSAMAQSKLCDGKDFAARMGAAIELMVARKESNP